MAFPGNPAGVAFLVAAAIFTFSPETTPAEATAVGLTAEVAGRADALTSLTADQLAQRISAQQLIIAINRSLRDGLEAPEPIYATERSALPGNREDIAKYRADFAEYSAAITAAELRLRALQQAQQKLLAESLLPAPIISK